MPLGSYIYSQKKTFLKDPNNQARRKSFLGQVYEASFCESLIQNNKDTKEDSLKTLAKYPYSKIGNIKTGFQINGDGSCIYKNQNIPLAEFDAIRISKKKILFYECLITDVTKNITEHKRDCVKKLHLLNLIFPNREISCVIVSDNSRTLNRFLKKNNFITQNYKTPSLDLLSLAKKSIPKILPLKKNMITVNELNNSLSNFNYIILQDKISHAFHTTGNLNNLSKMVASNKGLVKRVYWGTIEATKLDIKDLCPTVNKIVIVLDFSNISIPKIRYFVFKSGAAEVFLENKKMKVLNHNRPSRIELLMYKKHLKERSYNSYMKLTKKVAIFCIKNEDSQKIC